MLFEKGQIYQVGAVSSAIRHKFVARTLKLKDRNNVLIIKPNHSAEKAEYTTNIS